MHTSSRSEQASEPNNRGLIWLVLTLVLGLGAASLEWLVATRLNATGAFASWNVLFGTDPGWRLEAFAHGWGHHSPRIPL